MPCMSLGQAAVAGRPLRARGGGRSRAGGPGPLVLEVLGRRHHHDPPRPGAATRSCTAAVSAKVVLPAPGVATARKSGRSEAAKRSRASFCQGRRRTERDIAGPPSVPTRSPSPATSRLELVGFASAGPRSRTGPVEPGGVSRRRRWCRWGPGRSTTASRWRGRAPARSRGWPGSAITGGPPCTAMPRLKYLGRYSEPLGPGSQASTWRKIPKVPGRGRRGGLAGGGVDRHRSPVAVDHHQHLVGQAHLEVALGALGGLDLGGGGQRRHRVGTGDTVAAEAVLLLERHHGVGGRGVVGAGEHGQEVAERRRGGSGGPRPGDRCRRAGWARSGRRSAVPWWSWSVPRSSWRRPWWAPRSSPW